MKIEKVLTYGVIGYGIYHFFLKKSVSSVMEDMPIPNIEQDIEFGYDELHAPVTSFRYNGMSALRTDAQGTPLPCGSNGNPFTSQGLQGKFAKKVDLVAPTTFFAVLDLGSAIDIASGKRQSKGIDGIMGNFFHGLQVGDQIQLSVNGGQFTALDGQVVTILQLGTDNCTSDGQIQNPATSVVIDVPIVIEGASDWQYPSMEAFGTFNKIN